MEFSTFLLLQTPSAESSEAVFQRGVDITQAADELGFKNMWLAEHHFSTYGYLSRPLTFPLHLANKTSRIRVGTAVIVLPLHHPLTVAEEIATVDLLTGGRLDIGLGRGYQRYEFERHGADLGESRQRWEEEVDIILLALAGKPFTYDGTYYQIPETSVFPQPLQKPHPPIWVTAQSPESIEATVKRGFNLLSGGYGVPLERLRQFRQRFEELLQQYPPKQPLRVGTQRPVYVAESQAEARWAAEQARWNMRVTLSLRHNYSRVENGHAIPVPFENEPSTDEILDKFSVIGTPDVCIRQIRRLQEAMGIDHFNCAFHFGDLSTDKILGSMRRFAEQVMPAFEPASVGR
jgi:alkanesulfonate monooxygenase SsuD/methylene tetrahydromethanopterin reductase-like flavin-dependent oxidoreductase (luciferase family)